jgi:adenylate kinase
VILSRLAISLLLAPSMTIAATYRLRTVNSSSEIFDFGKGKNFIRVFEEMPSLSYRQRKRLLRHAAQSVGDSEGKVSVAGGDWDSRDPAGCGI